MTNAQTQNAPSNRVRPLVAWRAMQELFRDKEDTGQVFKIIEALKGKSLEKTTAKVLQTEQGRKLLSDRPDIIAMLDDREGLRALPEGSLGRAYLTFVESEDLSAAGLTEASEEAPQHEIVDRDMHYVGNRIRDTHDLYHVLTGYGRDGLGELCLLKYTNQHSYNRGIAFIVFMAQRKNKKIMPEVNTQICVEEAKRNARTATWLIDQPWEELLALPLEEVRSKLNIAPPQTYRDTLPSHNAAVERLTAMMAEQEVAAQAA